MLQGVKSQLSEKLVGPSRPPSTSDNILNSTSRPPLWPTSGLNSNRPINTAAEMTIKFPPSSQGQQ
jgi:hypothetical protein